MSSKKQSIISIGIGLIVIGAILLVFAFSEPKEPIGNLTSAPTTVGTTVSENQSKKEVSENTANSSSYSDTTAQASEATQSEVIAVTYPLNLNTCTEQELMSINGIGESRASAIIQYREYLGGYTSTEQIKDIKGFGESTNQKIAPYITV